MTTNPSRESDWTRDPESGRSNSSARFVDLCDEVARLIRGDAHALINGRSGDTARLVMAQLAHKHGLVPLVAVVEVLRAPQDPNAFVLYPDEALKDAADFLVSGFGGSQEAGT